jgi:hypothetical protein
MPSSDEEPLFGLRNHALSAMNLSVDRGSRSNAPSRRLVDVCLPAISLSVWIHVCPVIAIGIPGKIKMVEVV